MYLIGFPLLVVPLAIYNIIAFLMPDLNWTDTVATVHLMSGQDWKIATGDVLIAIALLMLAGEVMKSRWAARRGIDDHLLALLVCAGILAEFLLVKQAASSTFFLLLAISVADVISGFAPRPQPEPSEVALEPHENAG